MKRILSILLLAAALPIGCKASLGSTAADDARATDVGTTIGGVAAVIPGAPADNPAVEALTALAEREYQRRKEAEGPSGLSLVTQALGVLGAMGAAYLGIRGRRTTAHIDELYDETKALAVKAATTPPKT